jgi:hypothetical protein
MSQWPQEKLEMALETREAILQERKEVMFYRQLKAAMQEQPSGGGSQGSQAQVQPTKEEPQSLTVDGSPYAPVSLKKMIDQGHFTKKDPEEGTKAEKSMYVIIPCENGFEADDPNTINVMIADRVMQTAYFVDEVFPNTTQNTCLSLQIYPMVYV